MSVKIPGSKSIQLIAGVEAFDGMFCKLHNRRVSPLLVKYQEEIVPACPQCFDMDCASQNIYQVQVIRTRASVNARNLCFYGPCQFDSVEECAMCHKSFCRNHMDEMQVLCLPCATGGERDAATIRSRDY